MGSSLSSAPAWNEIEVSLFGPGYGECVLVHLGESRWLVVDACIDRKSRQPPALDYLDQLGVDTAEAVKLIVASHWHDDHVRGLAQIVERCSQARFCLSEAMTSMEFLTLVNAYQYPVTETGSGCGELSKVLHILQRRKPTPVPKSVLADMCLWSAPLRDGTTCKVYALSPSQAANLLAKRELGTLLQEDNERRRLFVRGPNHVAVVLWIEIGSLRILLGSDLEETANPNTGWSIILTDSTCIDSRASLFKVPHHGSETGHCTEVWQKLLSPEPVALLTPFSKSCLPRQTDKERICSLTDKAYITKFQRQKSLKRPKIVQDRIKSMAKRLVPLEYSMGHIRCRAKLGSQQSAWEVELLNDAKPLCL